LIGWILFTQSNDHYKINGWKKNNEKKMKIKDQHVQGIKKQKRDQMNRLNLDFKTEGNRTKETMKEIEQKNEEITKVAKFVSKF